MVRLLVGWATAILMVWSSTELSAQQAVALELVLALDTSTSVDTSEFELQRQGLAAAFLDQCVQAAIRATGPIAVGVVHWSGRGKVRLAVGWQVLASTADAQRMAASISTASRQVRGFTDIGGAITASADMIEANAFLGARQVIDVSGDGTSTAPGTGAARDGAVARGITINGLVIRVDEYDLGELANVDLLDHYERSVIGGPGAFVLVADGFDDFARAIRLKLLREISGPVYSSAPAPAPAARVATRQIE